MVNFLFLQDYPLFREFNKKEVIELTKLLLGREYSSGETILEEGKENSDLLFLEEGRVELFVPTKGVESRLAVLTPKSVLGKATFLNQEKSSFRIQAKDPVKIFVLRKKSLDQFPPEYQYLKYKLLAQLSLALINRFPHSRPYLVKNQ